MTRNVHFTASHAETARAALSVLTARYGQAPLAEADVVVALGGDGFMLQTLHATQGRGLPVYGMNRGTIGFLMNSYAEDDLPERIAAAEETVVNPLAMTAGTTDGHQHCALAINEVSLLRAGPQAARLRISIAQPSMFDGFALSFASRLATMPSAISRCWPGVIPLAA